MRLSNSLPSAHQTAQRGSVVETAYILYSNHAGGYVRHDTACPTTAQSTVSQNAFASQAYRLCKQTPGRNVTEECFQAGHLAFVGDTHIIQWGPSKAMRKTIPAVYTTNGTHPAGSM